MTTGSLSEAPRQIRCAGAAPLVLVALLAGCAPTGEESGPSPTATAARIDDGRPIVPGYETLHAANFADPAARGEILLGELNCLSCHAVEDDGGMRERITTNTAPDLTTIGARVTPGWLAAYLADPAATKRGTTMPDVFHGRAPTERASAAERLTHFLIEQSATLERPEHRPFRYRAALQEGRELFESVGCAACHAGEGGDGAAATPSVPLPDLAAKTTVAALARFLEDPAAIRHSGRMPSLYLTPDEARTVAVYLLRAQAPASIARVAGFEFEYFLDPVQDEDADGFFDRPPPVFDALTPEATGRIAVLSLDLPVPTNWGNHMFRYGSLIAIEAAGAYTFMLSSDRRSGSELLLDGQVVATKPHDTGREVTATVDLAAGDHAVTVTYFIRGDTEEPYLRATVTGGPLDQPTPLQDLVTLEDVRMTPTLPAFLTVDADLAAAGRRLFAVSGCVACHDMSARTMTPDAAGTGAGTRIETLSVDVGVDWHAAPGAPRYRLADHQREAIAAALTDLERLSTPRSPADAVAHSLATYNCYACHQRSDGVSTVGGPDPGRDRYFKVVPGLDLGDEGRVPPRLTGVGGKLKPAALESVLTEDRLHARRHYMQTRMPRFGGALITTLPAALDAADSIPGDLDEPPFTAEAIEDGRTLVGDTGLRCITCHAVGVHPAQGVSAINMARFYERVRPGWVRRWLSGPQAISPGTRMPDFWAGGSVIHPDIADGTMNGQIDAIYSYIALGSSMTAPDGVVVGDSLVLTPGEAPIIFRTFMTDASPRAIVVGYPESVHLAFDANVMRLVKVWRGGFYDAQGTWSGRAGRFLGPVGEDVITMPPGPALAFLDNAGAPWPAVTMTDRNVGGRFLGYRLDTQDRPIFMYRLDGVTIEESFVPVVRPGGASLRRRFGLEAGQVGGGSLYLLLGEGETIESGAGGSWTIDDSIRITLPPTRAAIVRSSQGVQQLLLPIGLTSGQTAAIDVEITW